MYKIERIIQIVPQLKNNPTRKGLKWESGTKMPPACARLFDLNDKLSAAKYDAPGTHIEPMFSNIYTIEGKELAVLTVKGVIYIFEDGELLGAIGPDHELFHDLERAIAPNDITTIAY